MGVGDWATCDHGRLFRGEMTSSACSVSVKTHSSLVGMGTAPPTGGYLVVYLPTCICSSLGLNCSITLSCSLGFTCPIIFGYSLGCGCSLAAHCPSQCPPDGCRCPDTAPRHTDVPASYCVDFCPVGPRGISPRFTRSVDCAALLPSTVAEDACPVEKPYYS